MMWAVVAALVGGTLLLAGVPKAGDHEGLLRVVRGYRLLPSGVERVVARVLPAAEIVVGALLVFGVAGRTAAAAAAVLFLGFFVGLTVNLARGRRELDCGCFAFGDHDAAPRIGWFHSVRAGGFAVVSIVLALTGPPGHRRARAGGSARTRGARPHRRPRGSPVARRGPRRAPARRRTPDPRVRRTACRRHRVALRRLRTPLPKPFPRQDR